ncbi:MAG: carboxypeptidase-like regulatory domain-containing protein [Gemmataceae bacterium]|nr:carboxypeptidase-like regulatory domain-containing protein [Gemmataceae bacterium]
MTLRNVAAAGLAVAVALLAGCSSTPPNRPDPVDVSGTVKLPGGQPAPAGLTLNFLPTSSSQAQVPTTLKAGGKFDAKLVPGKYTFAFEGSGVPAAYLSNDAAHTVEVPAGGSSALDITLN